MRNVLLLLPLEPKTITVLGHKVKDTDPAWTGLDWSRVQIRNQRQLAMPWCHPEDQTGSPDDFDCIYSVYPRWGHGDLYRRKLVKDSFFEKRGDKWYVALVFDQSTARAAGAADRG